MLDATTLRLRTDKQKVASIMSGPANHRDSRAMPVILSMSCVMTIVPSVVT